jgi:hypothetical protein
LANRVDESLWSGLLEASDPERYGFRLHGTPKKKSELDLLEHR